MKRLLNTIILIATALLLFSCAPTESDTSTPNTEGGNGEGYKLIGTVTGITHRSFDILITDTQDAYGTYRILLDKSTEIRTKDGKVISKEAIKASDTVEITYNGQVMRSIPPQVVALKIVVG